MVATPTVRRFATGPRGARGHGWLSKYRAGRGGRHLQGEYWDRNLQECKDWNDAILQLGATQLYLDVVVEPHSPSRNGVVPTVANLSGARHRLVIDVASTVMPETCANFIELCRRENEGYVGSALYRIERDVGLCGGDVMTNTGKAGKASRGAPLLQDVESDPLAMWHLPGTVSMLVPTVGTVDSRFMLITHPAFHLDGINRAFGSLTPDSLHIVTNWESSILTRNGVPTSFDLVIAHANVLAHETNGSQVAA